MDIDEKICREALKAIQEAIQDVTEACWEGAESSDWSLLTLGYVNGVTTLALTLTESKQN